MPDQLRNCPAQVYREKLGIELGKMSFYGPLGNCAGTYHFKKRNRS